MLSLVGVGVGVLYKWGNNGVIKFTKWESGDYNYQTGIAVENANKLRTPLQYKVVYKPNTRYVIKLSSPMMFGLRAYKTDSTFIKSFSNALSTKDTLEFTSPAKEGYFLMMINTTDTSTVATLKEVKPVYSSVDSAGYILLDYENYEMVVK